MADYDVVTIRRAENGYIVHCTGERGELAPTFVFNQLGGMQSEGCLVQWLAQNMPLERKVHTGALAAWSNVFGGGSSTVPSPQPPLPSKTPPMQASDPYTTVGVTRDAQQVANVRSAGYMAQAARALGMAPGSAALDKFLDGSS